MKELIDKIKEKSKACNIHSQNGRNIKGAYVDCIIMIQEWEKANCVYPVLGDGWRDVRKEFPVTPFLAYWTDGRMTVLEEGDSVAYAIVGNPDKRVIGWIPLSEIDPPAFA